MLTAVTLSIPNVLGGVASDAEHLPLIIAGVSPHAQVTLDMSAVAWVRPHGTIMLLGTCRFLAQHTGGPVRIIGLRVGVHAYLRRVNFFQRAAETAYTLDPFDVSYELRRRDSSPNVLELIPVLANEDVYAVTEATRTILGSWLSGGDYDIGRVVSLLSEACGNVVEHSGDLGVVTIQKHERDSHVDVDLAISDFGVGIRRSLIATHGNIAATPVEYIQRALGGLSARRTGRGGHGLDTIRQIATANGGSMYLRSESGSVLMRGGSAARYDTLSFFPGTQVAVTFRSRT